MKMKFLVAIASLLAALGAVSLAVALHAMREASRALALPQPAAHVVVGGNLPFNLSGDLEGGPVGPQKVVGIQGQYFIQTGTIGQAPVICDAGAGLDAGLCWGATSAGIDAGSLYGVPMGGDLAGTNGDAAVQSATGTPGGLGENGFTFRVNATAGAMAYGGSAPVLFEESATVTIDGGVNLLGGLPLTRDGGAMAGEWMVTFQGAVVGPGCDRGSQVYCEMHFQTYCNSDGGAGFAVTQPTCTTASGGFGGIGSQFTETIQIDAGTLLPYLYPAVSGVADAGPGCSVAWVADTWRVLR